MKRSIACAPKALNTVWVERPHVVDRDRAARLTVHMPRQTLTSVFQFQPSGQPPCVPCCLLTQSYPR
jgi:hypothetical protein